jgi:hypothetical protein
MVVWWRVHADGTFFIVGLEGAWSDRLGAMLPALCAGLSAALALTIVDAAAGPLAGIAAAIAVVALPGFVPLHRVSLVGPPLLTLTLATLGVMLQAPRFSLAYGTLAAFAAVSVAPAGIGLPVAAVAWALLSGAKTSRYPLRRGALAALPLALLMAISRWTGDGWSAYSTIAWHGGLDRAFRAAGTIVGDQLAPGIHFAPLRWFAVADISLLLFAVVTMAWLRVARARPEGTLLRRLYPAAGIVMLAYAAGLVGSTLLLPGAGEPDLPAVFPVVVIGLLVVVASVGVLWSRWHRVGRIIAVLLMLGWVQAAIRG